MIKDAHELKLLTFIHDCINSNSISLFQNYYKLQQSIHHHNTRHDTRLVVPSHNTELGSNSIKIKAAILWNRNPTARKYITKSKITMKKHLFDKFISTYEIN